jgi:hypothetical protein
LLEILLKRIKRVRLFDLSELYYKEYFKLLKSYEAEKIQRF